MVLHQEMMAMSRAVRPRILKLARQKRLVDECFKEFQRKVYPGAPPDQVREMRTCFFAGAQELMTMINFGADVDTMDATDADLHFMAGISDELERHHRRIIDLIDSPTGKPS